MSATHTRPPAGYTLLEVLIVVAIIGVLAGMMIPDTSAGVQTRLQSAAAILGRDIGYARNLAVTNADNYKITFDLTANKWTLTHSGTNTALDALPISPLHRASDTATQQTVLLDKLVNIGGTASLYAVWALSTPPQTVSDVEFQSLGETTRTQPTLVWLSAGTGTDTRYISVRVNPTTGLFWVENFQSTVPSTATFGS